MDGCKTAETPTLDCSLVARYTNEAYPGVTCLAEPFLTRQTKGGPVLAYAQVAHLSCKCAMVSFESGLKWLLITAKPSRSM